MTRILVAAIAGVLATYSLSAQQAAPRVSAASPLTIGETFTIESKVLGETRRINVYTPPPVYGQAVEKDRRLPVLYMLDGGIDEDFLHVAGLVQVSAGNETMRPFMLVGIENTQRRRDLTGPTQNAEDKKVAPQVGGSAAFRQFLRTELMPAVKARYRTTGESAVIGESLAGFFVVETLCLEPDLFDTYIAFDPSVWWNDSELAKRANAGALAIGNRQKTLYVAGSSEDRSDATALLATGLRAHPLPNLRFMYAPMPEEKHATIYHPAALKALRQVFKPEPVEREIYEAILADILKRPLPAALLILVTPKPLQRPSARDWDQLGSFGPQLRARVESSEAGSSEPFTLASFPPGAQLATLAELNELRAVKPNDFDAYWQLVRQRFGVQSLQTFSHPVVTDDGLQAFVAYGSGCGFLCGESGLVWAHRASRSDPWVVKRLIKIVS